LTDDKVKALCGIHKCSRSGLFDIYKKVRDSGTVRRATGSGRRPVLGEAEIAALEKLAKLDDWEGTQESYADGITKETGTPCSRSAVGRYMRAALKSGEWKKRTVHMKPWVNKKNREVSAYTHARAFLRLV